jgi:hypothetical protein
MKEANEAHKDDVTTLSLERLNKELDEFQKRHATASPQYAKKLRNCIAKKERQILRAEARDKKLEDACGSKKKKKKGGKK